MIKHDDGKKGWSDLEKCNGCEAKGLEIECTFIEVLDALSIQTCIINFVK